LLLVSVVFPGCLGEPSIEVGNAVVKPSPMFVGVYSGFMNIRNAGDGADNFVGFTVKEYPKARCEIHDVKDRKMVRISKVKIPASSVVELKPGSVHLMMFEMPKVEDVAGELTLVLKFQKSGEITVKAKVEM
jgi:hypothetical protein